jgi:hypothetical protein
MTIDVYIIDGKLSELGIEQERTLYQLNVKESHISSFFVFDGDIFLNVQGIEYVVAYSERLINKLIQICSEL